MMKKNITCKKSILLLVGISIIVSLLFINSPIILAAQNDFIASVKVAELGDSDDWKDYEVSDFENCDDSEIEGYWDLLKDVDFWPLSDEYRERYMQCLSALMDKNPEETTRKEMEQKFSEIVLVLRQQGETDMLGFIGGLSGFANIGSLIEAERNEGTFMNQPEYNNPLFNKGLDYGEAETVTPDTIIGDADSFMDTGATSDVATINQDNADVVFDSIYNILLAIGIAVTVIWGLVIAIKLMMSSVEEKAEYKKLLAPYLVGCVVIFGSFIIWKIIIVIMNNVL